MVTQQEQEVRVYLRPLAVDREENWFDRYCAQTSFPVQCPEELQNIFSTLEWLEKIACPLHQISLMIFPPLRLFSAMVFIPIGLLLSIFTTLLPQETVLVMFCIFAFVGLMNGMISTVLVADLFFQRFMPHLDDHFSDRNVTFRFVRTREGNNRFVSRYLSIKYREAIRQEDAIVDEEEAVAVVDPNKNYCIAIPISECE